MVIPTAQTFFVLFHIKFNICIRYSIQIPTVPTSTATNDFTGTRLPTFVICATLNAIIFIFWVLMHSKGVHDNGTLVIHVGFHFGFRQHIIFCIFIYENQFIPIIVELVSLCYKVVSKLFLKALLVI